MTAPIAAPAAQHAPALGILCILAGMTCISVNDMLIKQLSGGYPLHQMVFVRSAIGIVFTIGLVQLEGGWKILRTDRPWLHVLRGLAVVASNMMYFAALAVLPLATATALFFVAPLFITLLSIPVLGEKVGPWRLGAVAVGFCGVLLMLGPADTGAQPTGVLLLPVAAAFCYALLQVLTRKLGMGSKASAMAIYLQVMFILVSLGFWAATGDGRLTEGLSNESLVFLFRAWVWPAPEDRLLFLGLGLNAAVIGYTLSQAYRSAAAATVAPFEYVALPLAIFWGWAVFDELPGPWVLAGIALIAGAGLFVFLRERARRRPLRHTRPVQR
ncbi:DMT family transporter [Paralimibaculum aggregatum]|uniref:DMT family transporter n=1 Tax=Paralimibaculum aggregatum TaxID=3036245 RepID=A0ABQ6LK57_9RHOB|nr:DMT family transporter [Limibaculum sp. NKW23]GMG83367.1 DMT family transporter [Limibaculum sp. NKW23]